MLHSYSSIYNLGHRAVVEILSQTVIIEEKVDGCVSLETPILMADLSYKPSGLLKIGDELIGFNDTLNDPRLEKSTVTAATPVKRNCLDVLTSEGPITVSREHPFLIRQLTNNNGKIWVNAEELIPGMSIVSMGRWTHESSWESGYIAGQFDGEGSLVKGKNCNTRTLSYYQKTGPELDLVYKIINSRDFKLSLDIRRRQENWKDVGSLIIRKSWPDILRFLGIFRPQRLLNQSEKIWKDAPLNALGRAEVISVEQSRSKLVMGLSTSSGTYIANGLLSHNSQISFGYAGTGDLQIRSRGQEINMDAPEKMFAAAVESIKSIAPLLNTGYTYRGEYLQKKKHNTLAYDRIPTKNIIIFDIDAGEEDYLSVPKKAIEAYRIGLECVPVYFSGMLTEMGVIEELLKKESVLGGQKIEGVVIKQEHVTMFGPDKKALIAKHVSKEFKEIHGGQWRKLNPTSGDIIQEIGNSLKTPARWQKAVMHLRERGLIEDSLKDIGLLMREVPADIKAELEQDIKDRLFAFAWPKLSRIFTNGLPEWYKEQLAQSAFGVKEYIEELWGKPEDFTNGAS